MISFKILQDLSAELGDSFYIFKRQELVDNINEFRHSFAMYYPNVNLGYSVKTNYIPYACYIAYKTGTNIEVVSEMELEIALKLNIPFSNIIYNGPIKSIESLIQCLLNGAKVNVDNLDELLDIIQIVEKYREREFKIGFRMNVPLEDNYVSRFGFDSQSKDFLWALEQIKKTSNLKINGLHTHSTRPDKSIESYLKRLDYLVNCYNQFFTEYELEYIDLGGGYFGKMDDNIKRQFKIDQPISFQQYGEAIGQRMRSFFPDFAVELILEPGLALTVNILDFVCRVDNVRNIGGKSIATTSGSFHNIKPSGHQKNLTVDHFSLSKSVAEETEIAGYTCLENDIIHRKFPYRLLKGDFLHFRNIGAYTLVFKPIFIKLTPAIIELDETGYSIVKEYDRFEDLFRSYYFKY